MFAGNGFKHVVLNLIFQNPPFRGLIQITPDLAVEKVQAVISGCLPEIVDKARSRGVDLDDPYEVCELLSIDAVISLEDIQGQHHRVAISIVEREDRAYSTFLNHEVQ